MGLQLSESDRSFFNNLSEVPLHHSVPIYFGNPSGIESKLNNGTATLVKRNKILYVITNHHVLDEYLARKKEDANVSLQIGGLSASDITRRVIFDDASIDICVLKFMDKQELDFETNGNVPTAFYALGDDFAEELKGRVVAFGGYPGLFRTRDRANQVSFLTFSSGCSVVMDKSDRNIIVSINHDAAEITLLSETLPPEEIGGMSGGPVFEINKVCGFETVRLVGIIYECSKDYKALFARPLSLFSSVFSQS